MTATSDPRPAPESRPSPGPHAVDLRGPDGYLAAGAATSVGLATVAGAAHFDLPIVLAFVAGAVMGLLAVAALPSIPTRVATPLVLAAGGFVLTRYARAGAVSSRTIIAWGLATIATLIALERSEQSRRPTLDHDRKPRSVGVTLVAGGTSVIVLALALWPVMAFGGAAEQRGDEPDPFAATSTPNLWDANSFDTRGRPNLGDEIVMYVDADRPAFWRGAIYDDWDGTTWHRRDSEASVLARRGSVDGPGVVPAGLGARIGPTRDNRQTFEIVAPNAEVLFAAPEAVEVRSDHLVVARSDGTLAVPDDAFGSGARYTVLSQEPLATVDTLRAASGAVPDPIGQRYAQPATATDRLRALARQITESEPTTYNKVRAIEAWLSANVEYSLEAPLPPSDVADTVDWFVFDGRQGWCEQIASTLVVMLREVGVPARVATGFVTGDLDPLTGRYTVRAKDAHAWAEVWFPGVGWQGFDPTASVPLAGESRAANSVFVWMQEHAALFAAVVVVGVVAVLAVRKVVGLLRARRVRRRRPWATRTLELLERAGARAGRPRAPGETPTRYAEELATELDQPALGAVGAAIDADAFDRVHIDDRRRRHAEATLERLLG